MKWIGYLCAAAFAIFIVAQDLGFAQGCPQDNQCTLGVSKFACPVSNPDQSQSYACKNDPECFTPDQYHTGIDIVPASGTGPCCSIPVFAATTGTVHKIFGLDIGMA